MGGELIQKCVCRGVIRLTRIAQNASDAGEQDEQVQVAVDGRAVQMPCTQHLRPQHLLKTVPTLIRQRSIGQNAYAVNDTGERRQRGIDTLQHRVHRRRVRHIRDLHLHRDVAFAQGVDGFHGLGVGVAATVQHDCARAPFCQPVRQGAADTAQSTGHQVGSVLP